MMERAVVSIKFIFVFIGLFIYSKEYFRFVGSKRRIAALFLT